MCSQVFSAPFFRVMFLFVLCMCVVVCLGGSLLRTVFLFQLTFNTHSHIEIFKLNLMSVCLHVFAYFSVKSLFYIKLNGRHSLQIHTCLTLCPPFHSLPCSYRILSIFPYFFFYLQFFSSFFRSLGFSFYIIVFFYMVCYFAVWFLMFKHATFSIFMQAQHILETYLGALAIHVPIYTTCLCVCNAETLFHAFHFYIFSWT